MTPTLLDELSQVPAHHPHRPAETDGSHLAPLDEPVDCALIHFQPHSHLFDGHQVKIVR